MAKNLTAKTWRGRRRNQTFWSAAGKRSATPLLQYRSASQSGVAAALCHRTPRSSRRTMVPGDCSAKTRRRKANFSFWRLCAFCAFALKTMLNQLTISELTAKLVSARSPRARPCSRVSTKSRAWTKKSRLISYNADDALQQARCSGQGTGQWWQHRKRLWEFRSAVKDVLAVKNQPLNCGSKSSANIVSPYDATVVEKLKAAGAIVFGRLNMDEFAMGSFDGKFRVRHHAQSVGHHAHSRRLVRRRGGSGPRPTKRLPRSALTPAARFVSPPRCAVASA